MNKILVNKGSRAGSAVSARRGAVRDWQQWAPYAAVTWSLFYGLMGIYWAFSGRGFPYPSNSASNTMGPMIGRFGPAMIWFVVMIAGIPAAVMGLAMLRGVRGRLLRPLFIAAGTLLAGALLLLMSDLNVLALLGYTPYVLFSLFTGNEIGWWWREVTQWTMAHQVFCLIGGFIWLAATVCYTRRSGDACLYCGRRDGPEGWTSPDRAARWGQIAVYVAMIAPLFYAFTRYAWALGIPLGMSSEYWRQGQEHGLWIAGLSLATFGLVGAALMLGLVQRWGEVFPRWMIGLSGRRVPMALAVVPAAIVSVLLLVGGIVISSSVNQMVAAMAAGGAGYKELVGAIIFQVGPTLFFPIWGLALAVATLGYYYRRRGPCSVCGRGTFSQPTQYPAGNAV